MQAGTTSDANVSIRQALRLNQSLYTNVATRGVGGRQALKVMAITALFFGLLEFSSSGPALTQTLGAAGVDAGSTVAQMAWLVAGPALAHLSAWLIWTFLLWLIGARWTAPRRAPPSFGSVARALALAQSPILVAPVMFAITQIVVGSLAGSPGSPANLLLVAPARTAGLINAWILAGTFLALREIAGMTGGRVFTSVVGVGVLVAVLFGVLTVMLSSVAGREAVGLYPIFPPGFNSNALTAEDIAYRLDFNIGFLGLTDSLLGYLSRSILHPFAGAT